MFLHTFFKGFCKNIVFRSVALVINIMDYLRFFFKHSRLFTALYPTLCVKNKITKKFFKLLFMKSLKISR